MYADVFSICFQGRELEKTSAFSRAKQTLWNILRMAKMEKISRLLSAIQTRFRRNFCKCESTFLFWIFLLHFSNIFRVPFFTQDLRDKLGFVLIRLLTFFPFFLLNTRFKFLKQRETQKVNKLHWKKKKKREREKKKRDMNKPRWDINAIKRLWYQWHI